MSKHHLKSLIGLLCVFLFGCSPAKPNSPTILPTVTPIPAWHTLEGAGFQVWLPSSFLGGTNSNVDAVIPQLAEKDPSYAKIPQSLKQRGLAYIVFAVDTSSDPKSVTYMLAADEKLSTPLDISAYLDLVAKNLVAQSTLFNVIQKSSIPSDRYQMGKIVVELNTLESGDIKQVVYALKSGGAMWQISFTTPAEEFDKRSPIFDQIARSATLPYTNEPVSPATRLNPWVMALLVVAILGIGFLIAKYIYDRKKTLPVQAKKIVRKKRTKK